MLTIACRAFSERGIEIGTKLNNSQVLNPSETISEVITRMGYARLIDQADLFVLAHGLVLELSAPVRRYPFVNWSIRMRVRGGSDGGDLEGDFDCARSAEQASNASRSPSGSFVSLEDEPASDVDNDIVEASGGQQADSAVLRRQRAIVQGKIEEIVGHLPDMLELNELSFRLVDDKVPPRLVAYLRPLCFRNDPLSDQVFKDAWHKFTNETWSLQPKSLKDAVHKAESALKNETKLLEAGIKTKVYSPARKRIHDLKTEVCLRLLETLIGKRPAGQKGREAITAKSSVADILHWIRTHQNAHHAFVLPRFVDQFREDGAYIDQHGTSSGAHTTEWDPEAPTRQGMRQWMEKEESRLNQSIAAAAAIEGKLEWPIRPRPSTSCVRIPIVPSQECYDRQGYLSSITTRLQTVLWHEGKSFSAHPDIISARVHEFVERVLEPLDDFQLALLEAAPDMTLTPEYLKLAGFGKPVEEESGLIYFKWVPGSEQTLEDLLDSTNSNAKIVGARLQSFLEGEMPQHVRDRLSRYPQIDLAVLAERDRDHPHLCHVGRSVRGKARRHVVEASELLLSAWKTGPRPWVHALRTTPGGAMDIRYHLLSSADRLSRATWSRQMAWDEGLFNALFHHPTSTNVAQPGSGLPPPPIEPGGLYNPEKNLDRLVGLAAKDLRGKEPDREEHIIEVVKKFGWRADGATFRTMMRTNYCLLQNRRFQEQWQDPVHYFQDRTPTGHQKRFLSCFGINRTFELPFRIDTFDRYGPAEKDSRKITFDCKIVAVRVNKTTRLLQVRPGGTSQYRTEYPSPFKSVFRHAFSPKTAFWRTVMDKCEAVVVDRDAEEEYEVSQALGSRTDTKYGGVLNAQFVVAEDPRYDEDDQPDLNIVILNGAERHFVPNPDGEGILVVPLQLEAKRLLMNQPVHRQTPAALERWELVYDQWRWRTDASAATPIPHFGESSAAPLWTSTTTTATDSPADETQESSDRPLLKPPPDMVNMWDSDTEEFKTYEEALAAVVLFKNEYLVDFDCSSLLAFPVDFRTSANKKGKERADP
ncbi:hypothetical protein IAU59_002447 [Kwoniella sp. CBS 9459]